MKEGSKYQLLQDYLLNSKQGEVILTFTEIEDIMGDILPKSAWENKAWWSNRTKGALQAKAWMEAEYRVENVDFEQETITFRQPPKTYEVEVVDNTILWNGKLIKALRRHMGLTQTEFAKELGVYQQTVSKWENNAFEPTLATSKYLTMFAKQVGFECRNNI